MKSPVVALNLLHCCFLFRHSSFWTPKLKETKADHTSVGQPSDASDCCAAFEACFLVPSEEAQFGEARRVHAESLFDFSNSGKAIYTKPKRLDGLCKVRHNAPHPKFQAATWPKRAGVS